MKALVAISVAVFALVEVIAIGSTSAAPHPVLADSSDRQAKCILPAGPVFAATELADGTRAQVTPGALRIGDRVINRCNGLPGSHPTSVARWREGLAVGFRSGQVYYWDSGGFTQVAGLPASPVRAMAGGDSRLWVGTATKGLWSTDGHSAIQSSHRILRRRGITALHMDTSSTLHAGVDPTGWWLVDSEGAVTRRSTRPVGCFAGTGTKIRARPPGPQCHGMPGERAGGLPSAHLTALAVYRGALYIGTFDSGLVRRRGDTYEPVAGAPHFINALLATKDALYMATPKGLYAMRGNGRPYRVVLGLPSEHVNGLTRARDGTLWLATGAGLIGWSGGSIRVVDQQHGMPSRIVYAVVETADRALWAGTAAGAVRLSHSGMTLYSQASGAVPHDWITSLLPDGDSVLAGTYDAGVARLSPGGKGKPVAQFDSAWINPHGLFRIGGHILAATLGDGLIATRGDRRMAIAPLASDDVTAVIAHDAAIWVATRGGLVRLSAQPR